MTAATRLRTLEAVHIGAALTLTLRDKSFSPKDCSPSGVMWHVGINPVLPDAANPPCNAKPVILIHNEKEFVPAIRKIHQHEKKFAV